MKLLYAYISINLTQSNECKANTKKGGIQLWKCNKLEKERYGTFMM